MANNENENDDERLLNLLEPQADATLPPGYRWGRLADAGIGPPVAELRTVRRGNRIVTIPTAESLRIARAWETIRWPILDRSSPLAVDIWQEHAAQCLERQRELSTPSQNAEVKQAGQQAVPTLVRR